MTNSFSPKASGILSIIFSILLALLTIVVGWQLTVISEQNRRIEVQNEKLSELPEKYVRLERYGCDMTALRLSISTLQTNLKDDFKEINRKLDGALHLYNKDSTGQEEY